MLKRDFGACLLPFQMLASPRHGLRSLRSRRASKKGRADIRGTPAKTEGVYACASAG